jgi:hypothetical protein
VVGPASSAASISAREGRPTCNMLGLQERSTSKAGVRACLAQLLRSSRLASHLLTASRQE